jgi:S-adenosylmethionine:tRNA ribosyltransferase-isomerase
MDPLDDWDYELPPDRIARHPAPERAGSRLMRLPLAGGEPEDHVFSALPTLLREGDLLVANDTKVMPARLRAKRRSGGAVEVFLLEPGPGPVKALLRPARRLKEGEVLELAGGGEVIVHGPVGDGIFRVELDRDPVAVMLAQGEMPLPPYLEREASAEDVERYQTVYAGPIGSSAAPTAGLHFTPRVLAELEARGIGFAKVTLHVGIGTFRPLRVEDLERGRLHEEPYFVPDATAAAIARTRASGGRVIAVGTTSARTLEAATAEGASAPAAGWGTTDLFIRPGRAFRVVDGLVTNFHLPRSSLLMLVAALVGRERLLSAYAEAVRRGYRFYSYGDAMLLL